MGILLARSRYSLAISSSNCVCAIAFVRRSCQNAEPTPIAVTVVAIAETYSGVMFMSVHYHFLTGWGNRTKPIPARLRCWALRLVATFYALRIQFSSVQSPGLKPPVPGLWGAGQGRRHECACMQPQGRKSGEKSPISALEKRKSGGTYWFMPRFQTVF